jgi:hypothetical protein
MVIKMSNDVVSEFSLTTDDNGFSGGGHSTAAIANGGIRCCITVTPLAFASGLLGLASLLARRQHDDLGDAGVRGVGE